MLAKGGGGVGQSVKAMRFGTFNNDDNRFLYKILSAKHISKNMCQKNVRRLYIDR